MNYDWINQIPREVVKNERIRRGMAVANLYPKQQLLWDQVKANKGQFNTFAYGGAFGGGKTYAGLAIIVSLAMKYPGSHWTVVRETRQRCKETAWMVLKKFYGFLFAKLNESELVAILPNNSRIVFKGENIHKDPDLDAWKSFDTCGVFIEQAEEVSEEMYEMALLRAGRWIMAEQPPSFVLLTFNPADNWVKDRFYLPYMANSLSENVCYVHATIRDNPTLFNNPAYMAKFDHLDPITKARYMDGDWDAVKVDDPFLYAYDPTVHVEELPVYDAPLLLSFDFNVEPFTMTIHQHGSDFFHTIDEISIEYEPGRDQVRAICDEIKSLYPGKFYIVTGDASGRARDLRNLRTAYDAIQQHLNLSDEQIQPPMRNMGLVNSRILCNSVLSTFHVRVDPQCKTLIREMKNAKMKNGQLHKDRNAHKNDALDSWRYGVHFALADYLEWGS